MGSQRIFRSFPCFHCDQFLTKTALQKLIGNILSKEKYVGFVLAQVWRPSTGTVFFENSAYLQDVNLVVITTFSVRCVHLSFLFHFVFLLSPRSVSSLNLLSIGCLLVFTERTFVPFRHERIASGCSAACWSSWKRSCFARVPGIGGFFRIVRAVAGVCMMRGCDCAGVCRHDLVTCTCVNKYCYE